MSKGHWRRPYNRKKYVTEYDRIFRKAKFVTLDTPIPITENIKWILDKMHTRPLTKRK